ncbi:MAG: nucleotidyltransferase domain-containing protein [Puniceicoccaceae bacterium]|nr:nucleotidyltransferase domain-containing protein [Puniceicoccaceae bacterium]
MLLKAAVDAAVEDEKRRREKVAAAAQNRAWRIFLAEAKSRHENWLRRQETHRGKCDFSSKTAEGFGYGPFGEPLASVGPEATTFRFTFSTKYQDPETGYHYYGYRYYDADKGRWLSRDPIEEQGGVNLFGFVGNDGVNRWDYLGLQEPRNRSNFNATLTPRELAGALFSGGGTGLYNIAMGFRGFAETIGETAAVILDPTTRDLVFTDVKDLAKALKDDPCLAKELAIQLYGDARETVTDPDKLAIANASSGGAIAAVTGTGAANLLKKLLDKVSKSKIPDNLGPLNRADIQGIRAVDDLVVTNKLAIPQGLSARQFDRISSQIRSKADELGLGSDIFVQGSRAGGTVRATSDIDIAIRVSPEQFNAFINNPKLSRLSNPNAGSNLADTRLHALETGKIQSGEARLSGLSRQIANDLGIDVDLSIIRAGGQFDNGPQLPLSFDF